MEIADKASSEAAAAAVAGAAADDARGLGSAETETRSTKVGVAPLKGGVYSVLPIQQPSSDPTLTCSGLDTGIQIEDFISNEAEEAPAAAAEMSAAVEVPTSAAVVITEVPAAAATEVVVVSAVAVEASPDKAATDEETTDVPMGKNSIEIEVTTTAGENEAVVGPVATEKLSRSCVVNMASLDEGGKKKGDAAAKGGKPPNGAVRGRKAADKPAAEPKPPAKRGRKPGTKNADKSKSSTDTDAHTTLDLTALQFTDAQQHQLRAQILVYGAIIQAALPDEALMGASFMDTSRVCSGDACETYYAATRTIWEKTYKATADRITRTSGQKPTMVSSGGPPAPFIKHAVISSLPPKPGAKGKSTTKSPSMTTGSASELPSVSPLALSAMNMASATVSSWSSARARAPEAWHSQNAARPPRFPFQQTPSNLQGPWGTTSSPVQWGFGSFSAAGITSPPTSSVVVAAGQVDSTEPRTKRRRTGDDPAAASVVPVIEVPEDSPTAPEKTPSVSEKATTSPEEYVRQVEVAKQSAEDAASASASMVQQSQRVWEEIKEKAKNNSMTQKEAHYASCMVTISTAASVAKAASAIVNVAYAAALQAKAMATEAPNEDPSLTLVQDKGANLIASAKKAAMNQVKSGLAACQQAENVAAIVRAAELASEAACHAGELMCINPTPVQEKGAKAKGKRTATPRGKVGQDKNINNSRMEEDRTEIEATANADAAANAFKKDGAAEQPENATEAELSDGMVENRQHLKPAEIKEGSHIEIVPDEDGLQGVWFAALVLEIKDDQALVKYDDLLSDDGETPLEEWVDLTGHLDNVPRVRIAHPMTTDSALRRRRRAAMGNQTWMQGDHVDVWMRDGWWEGIVQSVVEEDHTVTVFFPADGDTESTKSWNLRPSLLWHNGAWIPWREMQEPQKPSSPATTDDSQDRSDNEITPPKSRGRTKRRKFSEVMGKEDDKMKALQSVRSPVTGAKPKKPSPRSVAKRPPTSARKSAERKRSTSSDVTTDDGGGETRKSSRQCKAKRN